VSILDRARWISAGICLSYLAAYSAAVYTDYVPLEKTLFSIVPLLLGLLVRRWWILAVPAAVLLPLPVFLALSPEVRYGQETAFSAWTLVALWTAIASAFLAKGVWAGAAWSRVRSAARSQAS
jgi:hypothetical protein